MPDIEDQLRRYGQALDAAAMRSSDDTTIVPPSVDPARRRRPLLLAASMAAVLLVAAGAVTLVVRESPEGAQVNTADGGALAGARPVTAEDLADQTFLVTSIERDGTPQALVEPHPTIGFERRQLSIDAGCNGKGGVYSVTDGRIVVNGIGGTQIHCPGDLGRQENDLTELFVDIGTMPLTDRIAPTGRIAGDTLELRLRGLVVRAERFRPVAAVDLAGHTFDITWIGRTGAAEQPLTDPPPSLVFGADRLMIETRCTSGIAGTYAVSDSQIAFEGSPMGPDHEVCLDSSQEGDLYELFFDTTSNLSDKHIPAARIAGDVLELRQRDLLVRAVGHASGQRIDPDSGDPTEPVTTTTHGVPPESPETPETSITPNPSEPFGELVDGTYLVHSIEWDGGPLALSDPPPSLTFSNGILSIDTKCNGVSGPYARVGDQIDFEGGPMTLRGCMDPAGSQETALVRLFLGESSSARAPPTLTVFGPTIELRGNGLVVRARR